MKKYLIKAWVKDRKKKHQMQEQEFGNYIFEREQISKFLKRQIEANKNLREKLLLNKIKYAKMTDQLRNHQVFDKQLYNIVNDEKLVGFLFVINKFRKGR